ncbi:hypothetical protein [Arenibacter nanhaiticus]|uniref:hypothetical protein n=1 Tax=Arenibacter nanhaiticus TaxID=558155 RepID=UPI0015B5E8AD|nr:hypothetical protein [Arenibacter nanhaiticus]
MGKNTIYIPHQHLPGLQGFFEKKQAIVHPLPSGQSKDASYRRKRKIKGMFKE